VNIFFELNKHLAKMMKNLTNYQIDLEEIHHTQKEDAPSGCLMESFLD
jgi:4-hydroxy-tetrahydrodipicolinate reductase